MFNLKNVILAVGVLIALLGIVNTNLAIFGFGVLIGIIALFILKVEEKLDEVSPAVPTPEPVKAPEPAPVVVKAPEPVAPPAAPEPVKQEVKKPAPAIKAPAVKAQPTAAPKKRGRKPTKK